MRIYWDSSALLNALASRSVLHRLQADEHLTRSHGFVEVFSHLTGRGLPIKGGTRQKVGNEDAAKMLRALESHLKVVELPHKETMQAIEDSRARGVTGGRIHDLLHARAAMLAKADLILTRDASFASLGEGIRSEWP